MEDADSDSGREDDGFLGGSGGGGRCIRLRRRRRLWRAAGGACFFLLLPALGWVALTARYAPYEPDSDVVAAGLHGTGGATARPQDERPCCCLRTTAEGRGCVLDGWFAWQRSGTHLELELDARLYANSTAYTLFLEFVSEDDEDARVWQQRVLLAGDDVRWLPSADRREPRRFAHTVQHERTWYRLDDATAPEFSCATLHAPHDRRVGSAQARPLGNTTAARDVAPSLHALLRQHNRTAESEPPLPRAGGDALGGLLVPTADDLDKDPVLQTELQRQREAAAREQHEREHAELVRNVCLAVLGVLFAGAALLTGVYAHESARGRC